jgi:hypothetical protein
MDGGDGDMNRFEWRARHVPIGLAALVAIGVAVIVARDHQASDGAHRSSHASQKPAAVPAPATRQRISAGIATIATPLDRATPSADTIPRYLKLANCAKFARMRTFAHELKADPHSWLNDDAARARLGEDALKEIEQSFAFIEKQRALCEPMRDLTSDDALILYEAALAAADAGDAQAAQCFALAVWPAGFQGDAASRRIYGLYASNVHRIAEAQVRAGNWKMVEILSKAHNTLSQGPMAVAIPADPATGYGYQMLMMLGTRSDDEELVREQALLDMLVGRTTPGQRAERSRWATETYAKSFRDRPFHRSDVICDY